MPWIWRAEFLGAFDDADRALLDAGWHLVQVDVPDRYGDPVSMAAWWSAYRTLVDEFGFHPRPGLIALSRGGLYAIAWASDHPECVSAIYLDNAVCDLRSWPGGRPHGYGRGTGAPEQWQEMLNVFGFGPDDSDALAAASPISKLAPLATARIPLLVVYGDSDQVVPAEENSEVLVSRYAALGGPSTSIIRPGADHHPHSIDDAHGGPTVVSEFFESARRNHTS
ncbi:pimeloyl-ACP methyl ester carboxylesterase [Kribbella aluminosa]|uniref:Pimeloyl-ACP methyl ester carboxylesterase n=1 Tax=Kribbella aluminosa TaxID=416017 RepID=A0ABS4UWU1_9ACTN|nr:alpha/beta hydrolase [Kribbella aluminosa]MBP2356120.1 pimeloyl-ACP methyl ester carboxylesterase [Kribbella aluminosa]